MKEIVLGNGMTTQVDDADFEWLSKWNWVAMRGGEFHYASRWPKKTKGQKGNGAVIWMGHEIFGSIPDDMVLDYIDRNPLNNQRSNLRLADKYQDRHNRGGQKTKNGQPTTSIYKGVSFNKRSKTNPWVMQLSSRGVKYHDVFDDEIKAAKAYDRLAKIHHGEFAFLNFPESEETPLDSKDNNTEKFDGRLSNLLLAFKEDVKQTHENDPAHYYANPCKWMDIDDFSAQLEFILKDDYWVRIWSNYLLEVVMNKS